MIQVQSVDTIEEINARIAQLPSMDKAGLLKVWLGAFPIPPPPKLRKELMVPILAYRLQEIQHGGLSHSARNRLRDLMAQNRNKLESTNQPTAIETSAKLVRSWHGEIHEVIILDDGYLYRGERFKRLSPIARRITGTPWSGPAFFGTRPRDLQK